jgi:hypothetical protein
MSPFLSLGAENDKTVHAKLPRFRRFRNTFIPPDYDAREGSGFPLGGRTDGTTAGPTVGASGQAELAFECQTSSVLSQPRVDVQGMRVCRALRVMGEQRITAPDKTREWTYAHSLFFVSVFSMMYAVVRAYL